MAERLIRAMTWAAGLSVGLLLPGYLLLFLVGLLVGDPVASHERPWGAVQHSLVLGGLALGTAVLPGVALGLVLGGLPGARGLRASLRAIEGLPTLLAGVAAFAGLHLALGLPPTLVAAGALGLVALPRVAVVVDRALAGLPEEQVLAARALGLSRHEAIAWVALPSIRRPVLAGLLTVLARVLGEAAPLVVLGSMAGRALPVRVAMLAPAHTGHAWGLALLLALSTLGLHLLARGVRA